MYADILAYYANPRVKAEIAEYCRNRWVAVHCERTAKNGRFILLRYYKGKPLTISNPEDVDFILKKFKTLKPRAFYATANLYFKNSYRDNVLDYFKNVYARTMFWDIDSKLEWWRVALKIARAIVQLLETHGVRESVYLKWSGRGLHVHLHEKSISARLYSKISPLDLTYSLVEYITIKCQRKLNEINTRENTTIKVENLMDPQRIFVVPLSLHRVLYVSCVVFTPEDIDSFDPSWLNPRNYRHQRIWKNFKEGEADELALKAIKIVGGYPKHLSVKKKKKPLEDQIRKYLP